MSNGMESCTFTTRKEQDLPFVTENKETILNVIDTSTFWSAFATFFFGNFSAAHDTNGNASHGTLHFLGCGWASHTDNVLLQKRGPAVWLVSLWCACGGNTPCR